MELVATERWKQASPGALVGVVGLRHVLNPERDAALEAYAADVESRLRARFFGADRSALAATPVLRAYADYYKRFDKTYHVRLQLESVVFKGKPITGSSALVLAMFVAELKNMLLTAVHDVGAVRGDVTVDAATGTESYRRLNGEEQVLKPNDMFIRDEAGILSSIVYGPDWRTRVTPRTESVIFTVYAPVGISRDELEAHLADLESTVRSFSPDAVVETREALSADQGSIAGRG
jgi:DNA/RNA-binding domain of Phe-tRNA-synthetase-like protein